MIINDLVAVLFGGAFSAALVYSLAVIHRRRQPRRRLPLPRPFDPSAYDPDVLFDRLLEDIERNGCRHGYVGMGGVLVKAARYGPQSPSAFAPWGEWHVSWTYGNTGESFTTSSTETMRSRTLFELRRLAGERHAVAR